MTARTKHILITTVVVLGLSLIVGATRNLPASAQGLVTGQNDILIDQLADRVGERALVTAVLASEQVTLKQNCGNSNEARRGNRRGNRRTERRQRANQSGQGRNGVRLNGNLDDQLAQLGPDAVYQIYCKS